MASRPHNFTARVRQEGPSVYIAVPPEVSDAFARHAFRGRVRFFGKVRGVDVRGILVRQGGVHRLVLHTGMRAATGVSVGDEVEVTLRASAWDEVPLSPDFVEALESQNALETFEALSTNERYRLQRWVDRASSSDLRQRRMTAAIEQVLWGRQPDTRRHPGRRIAHPWTCPRCGDSFTNRNQWHSCRRPTLNQVFARSTSEVRDLFETLRTTVESIGPVDLQLYREHFTFVVGARFLKVIPKKRWLDLSLWLPRRVRSSRFRKVETPTTNDYVHLLRLTDEAELDDELIGWLGEAYRLGNRREAGRDGRHAGGSQISTEVSE